MVTLSDLARKEQELPPEAVITDILRNADEVEAFAIGEPDADQAIVARLLIRYARRITASAPANIEDARLVLALAAAGHRASEAAKASGEAYEAAYEQVRIAVDAGMSQSDAARVSGLDRMTVRKAIGKPRAKKSSETEPPVIAENDTDAREERIIETAADDLFSIEASAEEGDEHALEDGPEFDLLLADEQGAKF